MKRMLKRLAARLPLLWQQELKRWYFGRQIGRGKFGINDPEFELLPKMVSPGDWVLDIGANIGHYTIRLSDLVGENGRVISFEPVPATFELLASNAARTKCKNITLVNAAASGESGLASMTIPKFDNSKVDNYYMAQLSSTGSGNLRVLCLPVDSLLLPHAIRLVKIDAEGHELAVLLGMKTLIQRDHPILIVEDNQPEITELLTGFGYTSELIGDSANRIFLPEGEAPDVMRPFADSLPVSSH